MHFKQCISIFFCMKTVRTPRRKTGPKPMSSDVIKASFALPRDLWNWAADQPEGASALLRDLLQKEREQRRAESPPRAPVAP